MARAISIVPPEPRVEKVGVMRRLKTRRALQTCIAAAASALGTILVSPLHSQILFVVLVGVAGVSAASALVLRLVEQPREIVVRKVHYKRDPPGLMR